jgi:hypothetical protein
LELAADRDTRPVFEHQHETVLAAADHAPYASGVHGEVPAKLHESKAGEGFNDLFERTMHLHYTGERRNLGAIADRARGYDVAPLNDARR